MSEIVFGTTEHIAGLSREALEADFRYVQDRRTELEEACERLQAENAELKAENAHLWESVQNAEHEESVAWDRVRSAERRNDKLRELVRELSTFADHACDTMPSCDRCPMHEGTETCCLVDIHSRERVLGVEI